MSNVKNITDANHDFHVFKEDANRVVVLDFYADWCGPCKAAAPKFEALARVHDADFYKVDTDKEHGLASEYGIKSLPTFIIVKGGEVVEYFHGSNLAPLVDKLDELGV